MSDVQSINSSVLNPMTSRYLTLIFLYEVPWSKLIKPSSVVLRFFSIESVIMERGKFYEKLLIDIASLIEDCDCPISNCANISSLLYNRLRGEYGVNSTNWIGFYFRSSSTTLQLGPFCGLPACQLLKFSKGLCFMIYI